MYGTPGVGLFSLALSVWLVAAVASRLGLDLGAVQAIAGDRVGKEQRARTAGVVLSAALLLGCLVGALLAAAAPLLGRVFQEEALVPALRLMAAGLPFLTCLWIAGGLLQGDHRVVVAAWTRDVAHPALMNVGIVLTTAAAAPLSVRFGTVMSASAVATGGFLTLVCIRHFDVGLRDLFALGDERLRRVIRYSLPLTLVGIVNATTQWLDRLIVGYFLPTTAVGLYDISSRLARLASVSLVATGTVFAPFAASLARPEDQRKLENAYQTTARWGLYLGLPALVLLLVRPELLLALFGEQFEGATDLARVLALGQLVNVITGPCGLILMMCGYQSWEARNTVITATAGVAASAWSTPRFGVLGAAVALAGTVAAMNLVRMLQVRRLLRVQPLSFGMIRAAAAATLAALALLIAPYPTGLSLVPLLGEQVALALGVYLVANLLIGLERRDRQVLLALWPGARRS